LYLSDPEQEVKCFLLRRTKKCLWGVFAAFLFVLRQENFAAWAEKLAGNARFSPFERSLARVL
jgi:hypothetical protein